jgi:hypothetical protein
MFESTTSRLLSDLHAARARLRLQGDRIAWSGPLTPRQLEQLRRCRQDLVELLELHGDALLPLFRDPARPLTARERHLLDRNANALRRRFRAVDGRQLGEVRLNATGRYRDTLKAI